MHPEIKQDTQGTCPKCGMNLVPVENMSSNHHVTHETKSTWKSYLPLMVIIGIISVTTLTISYGDYMKGFFNIRNLIMYFMTGFFLTFAGFKLMDLKGFAEGYATYDLLAKRWYNYGYIYPFIELFFGLSMILLTHSVLLLWIEFIVMTFSGIGVAIKLLKKEKFQCACLGTFLKVPLTKVTVVENFGMALLALLLIILI